jgi:voltage-gated potassium channel
VFIFVVTSAVYVTQNDINPQISNYVDALYFTITTLTTTGFGDITLQGPGGRLFAVVKCPDCGLLVHDADAVHCKHCGRVLHIETEGGV